MRAAQLTEHAGPDAVRVTDIPEPEAGDSLVLVDLHAAGVPFPDLLQTTGGYQMVRPLPCVLGAEAAGIVRSAPEGSGLTAGQRVAVLSIDGSWQQTVALPRELVFPLPDSVSLTAGAGMLMNYFTAHFALDERARYRAGETVLAHGAPGGRAVVLGFTGGSIPTEKVNRLLLKNISVVGAGWGEYLRTDPGYPARQWAALEPLLRDGTLVVPEPTLHPLDEAPAALRSLENRSATGKVALDLTSRP